jgi:hypothetical protein
MKWDLNRSSKQALRLTVLGATLSLAACAWVDDKAMSMVASSADVLMVINGRLLLGELQLQIDHTGTLAVATPEPDKKPPVTPVSAAASKVAEPAVMKLSCAGQFRYTSTTAGAVDLRCNDGTSVDVGVAMLSSTRGYGYGQTAEGPVSMTFGLTPQAARSYLVVPPGKQLKTLPKSPFFEIL